MNEKKEVTLYGLSGLAQSIRTFGYCIVASTVIPTAIIVTYLNGAS